MVKKLLPRSLILFLMRRKESYDLNRIPRKSPDVSSLSGEINEKSLCEAFSFVEIEGEWSEDSRTISSFSIVETAGGVNVGDRRAIYYLLRRLRPKSVLEIGTHVGASTIHAVAALKRNQGTQAEAVKLATVDISDVNDPTTRPWIQWGSKYSLREMVQQLGAIDWVTFLTRPSLEFFSTTKECYDFIFLDGDHSAKTVYQEIPAALEHLNSNGVILLHDYFPSGKPLWKGTLAIPGPWLAARRFQSEGLKFKILPLGELPWPTKLKSNVTSLALLVR